ncbi:thioredoxin family protein [Culicoidibacter larvae]|nr:thioredoxin family protein [Culicoidibacter larvae]
MQTFNEQDAKDYISEHERVVIYVTTPFCGVCQSVKPLIGILAEAMEDVRFGEINLNLTPDLAKRYQISGAPTLLQFTYGELVQRVENFQNITQLYTTLERGFLK